MQITLNLPDSLTQTDTFNQSDWLREIAIALFQQKILLIKQAAQVIETNHGSVIGKQSLDKK